MKGLISTFHVISASDVSGYCLGIVSVRFVFWRRPVLPNLHRDICVLELRFLYFASVVSKGMLG
jgi:hypothetical protein